MFLLFSFFIFLLLFKNSCLHFPATTFSCPTYPQLSPSIHTPIVFVHGVLYKCSLVTLPLLSPVITFPTPLQLLSICSLFQCLSLYFACLFVLLIRFHLQVRSYGIFLLLSITLSRYTHAVTKEEQGLLLSFCCILFHHVNVPQFFDPLIH